MPSNSTDTVAVVPELENDTKTGTKTREQLHAEAQLIANIWEKPKTWKGYIWDALDKPKAERRFLLKLDLTLLTVTCLGTFIRTLDQNNVNNAFLSGMREDLSLYGNELQYMNACFQVGYALGQIPVAIAMNWIPPHTYLACLEISWAILTFGMAGVKNENAIYAIRFFIGFLESGFFPVVISLCGSYYTPMELAKRTVIIQVSSTAGGMFAGYLQAAAFNHLSGVGGLPGWKWGFLIDGLISFPIGLAAYFLAPDLPNKAKPNWKFSQADLDLANARRPREANDDPEKLTKKKVLGYFKTWHIYLFSLLFICTGSASNPSSSMGFWFKFSTNPKFSVAKINTYPTAIQGIQCIFSLVMAWSSDTWMRGRRWPPVLIAATVVFAVDISLGAMPVYGTPSQRTSRWALYYLTTLVTGSTGIIWAYLQECLLGDFGRRAFAGATMNMMSVAFQAWVPAILFPTYDQPYVVKGNFGTAGFVAGAFLFASLIAYFDHRDKKAALNSEVQSLTEKDTEEKKPVDIEKV